MGVCTARARPVRTVTHEVTDVLKPLVGAEKRTRPSEPRLQPQKKCF